MLNTATPCGVITDLYIVETREAKKRRDVRDGGIPLVEWQDGTMAQLIKDENENEKRQSADT